MTIFVFFVLCITQPLFFVVGKREPLQRFLTEDGVKPPIFGSYSYDPLKQEFEPLPECNKTSTPQHGQEHDGHHSNDTNTDSSTPLSTIIGHHEETTASANPRMVRKGSAGSKTTRTIKTIKPTVWWLRPKLVHVKDDKNATLNKARTL